VRNECGHKDPWPRWSYRYAPGTGPSGRDGFKWFPSLVEDSSYDHYRHSDFFSLAHMKTHWLPFLRTPRNPLAIRHGRDVESEDEFIRIFVDTDKLDKTAFGKRYTDDAYVTDEIALGWIRVNPDIYTFLIDRGSGRTVGYLNAPPLTSSMYSKLRRGQADDNEITGRDIVEYDHDQQLKIYLMSIVIDASCRHIGHALWQQAYVQLIGGFLDMLADLARHKSIFVTHLLATAWTDEGERICKSLGMTPVGKDRFGDQIYEVNLSNIARGKRLMPALTRLLAVYRKTRDHRP
jgi:hypothetical protein